ncbi:hypothetical protein D3C76_852320 [compost metagenome]
MTHGELEFEQVVERQAKCRDSAVDVANGQRGPHSSTVRVCLDAVDLHRPSAVLVALPPDGLCRQLVGVSAGGSQFLWRVRNRMPVKPQNISTKVRTIQLKQQYFVAWLQGLNVLD